MNRTFFGRSRMTEVPQGEHATFSFLDLITLGLILEAIPDFTHGKVVDGVVCLWLGYANHAIGVRWKISRYLIPCAAFTLFAYAFRFCIGLEGTQMKYIYAGALGAIILVAAVMAYSWVEKDGKSSENDSHPLARDRFSVTFNQIHYLESDGKIVEILLNLTIVNSSSPTSVYSWHLGMKSDKVSVTPIVPTLISTSEPIVVGGKPFMRFHENNLLENNTRDPLPTNKRVGGWLRFVLPAPQYTDRECSEAVKELAFKDADEKDHIFTFVHLPGGDAHGTDARDLRYYPESGDNPYLKEIPH
jgi:hypothetical protein